METRKRAASQRPSTAVETQEDGPSQKRAKLVLKPPPQLSSKRPQLTSSLEDCLDLETAEEVLGHLLELNESSISSMTGELDASLQVFQKLWRTYESHVTICSVVTHLLGRLVARVLEGGRKELPEALQLFLLSTVEHANADVKVAALKCLQEFAGKLTSQTSFVDKMSEASRKEINNLHHGVRVECLNLIGQLVHVTGDAEIPLAVLEESSCDADPRVRAAAFKALFSMQRSGKHLPLTVYSKASEALADGSEDVRTMATRLVWALALFHSDKVVPLKQDPSLEMRLLDDAFTKICDMVNDEAMAVRALAASLLGDFSTVSWKFLEQTLDKKLMSHLKVVKSEHERQLEKHQGGGSSMDWDSGRKWTTSSAPKMVLDPGGLSLMSAGACGAFVHGLEDEFMEVRSAAVGSMCRLGVASHQFAGLSMDYLVDMFNDEIEAVRLKAISTLRQISAEVRLREDQLETVLGILEESSSEIREGLRELLSSCQITTQRGLNSTVHALLDNLKKYPGDRPSVWRCLQQLGGNHGNLVSALVPELLSTHPFFMGKEPDEDDPAYISILILVFNAAARCPTIPPLFPSHVFRHYTYLRDTLPQLVPSIRIGAPVVRRETKTASHSGARSFLRQIFSRAQLASRTNRGAQRTWLTCVTDLQQIAKLNSDLAPIASCAAAFLQCQLLIDKVSEVLSQDVLLTADGSSQLSIPHINSNIRELLLLSYRMEHTFVRLSPRVLQSVRMVRLAAHGLFLLLAVKLDLDTEDSTNFVRMKQLFMERLKSLQSYCDAHKLDLPPVLAAVADLEMVTVATDTLREGLEQLVSAPFCTGLSLAELRRVKQCRAVLNEPQECGREDFTKFVATLALSVNVDASLHHVECSDDIAIQAKFPDGRRLLFPLKSCEVREVGVAESKVESSVIVSHGVWTDPSQVEFCVVKSCSTDIDEDNCFHFSTQRTSAPQTSTKTAPSSSSSPHTALSPASRAAALANPVHSHTEDQLQFDQHCLLAISRVVKINLYPQEKISKSFNVFQ